jgi:hypothetical protein
MTRLGLGAAGAAGALLLALLLHAAPVRADDAIPEEAKLYFKNGVELIQSQPPNYQDAYYQFKLAWEKSKSWKVLSNWGLTALKLERDGEAIWAYTEYLKQKDIDPEERKDLERDLLLLNGNAASVSLSSDIADLEVVDARGGSSVPPQSYRLEGGQLALRLRAGSHTLTASSQGKSLRWEVTLSPGRTDEHRFDFAPATAAAAAPVPGPTLATPVASPPLAEPPSKSSGTLRTIGYVAAGAGLVGLGVGVFMGAQAKSQESDARKQCQDTVLYGFACPERARTDFDKAQQNARLANVVMIAGGVVAAGGVVMIIVGGAKEREGAKSARLTLSPLLGVRDAGIFASGAF